MLNDFYSGFNYFNQSLNSPFNNFGNFSNFNKFGNFASLGMNFYSPSPLPLPKFSSAFVPTFAPQFTPQFLQPTVSAPVDDTLPKPSLFETSLLTGRLNPVNLEPTQYFAPPRYVVSAIELQRIKEQLSKTQRVNYQDFETLCISLHPDFANPAHQRILRHAFEDSDYTGEGSLDFDGFLVAYALVRSAKLGI